MNPFVIFWRAGRDLFDDLFLMMGLNLLWFVIVMPLFVLAGFFAMQGALVYTALILLLNVLLFGPANAGLLEVAERITDGRVASFAVFFEGWRKYSMLSWKIYGLWMLGMVVMLANVWFYLQMTNTLGVFLMVLFGYLTAIWLTLLIYLGPMMVLREAPTLRSVWRDAAVLNFGRPIFTLITAVLMALIIGLSGWVVILAILLLFAFLSLWSMRTTKASISFFEQRRIAREEQANAEPPGERAPRGQVRPRK